jgi:O-antigen ligase
MSPDTMLTIRKLRVEGVVAFVAIAMIAFHIYWQYWFVDLMGVWVVNPLLPIAILTIVALTNIWRDGRWPAFRVGLPAMWAFLALYLLCASISTLVNETDLRPIINWLVYAWSPPAVLLSIYGLKNLRDDNKVNLCAAFLCLVMVVLSIYAYYSLNSLPYRIEKPILKWGENNVVFDTRPWVGRFTIPGLNSTHYAPMLLPLIFLGLYWVHQTTRVARYVFLGATGLLAYCLFAAQTRAALVPLIVGLIYLVSVRWFRWRTVALSGCAIVGLFFVQPIVGSRLMKLTLAVEDPIRQVLVAIVREPESATRLASGSPSELDHLVIEGELEHPVLAAHALGLAARHPILGLGMGHLVELQNSTLARYGGKTHNNFLAIAAGFGFPALLFYILFIISLGVYLRRVITTATVDSETWRLGHTWMAILISYALYENAAPADFHFVWLWLALIAVWVRNRQDKITLTETQRNWADSRD